MLDRSQIFSCSFARIGPVVQRIVRKSPELDIPVRFWTGLQDFLVTFWVKPRHLSIAKKFIELIAPTPVHEEAKIPCTAALSTARFCSILSGLDYKPFLCFMFTS